MNNLTESIIVDIIRNQMNLPDDQVWIRNQNYKIPNTNDLFVVVGMVDSSVFGAITPYLKEIIVPQPDPIPDTVQVWEVNETQINERIQIDIFSRSTDAITRRYEVITALNSIYSKQQQEANYFKIARLPRTFVNSSDAEGGSNINRFSLVFPCLVWYRNTRLLSETGGDYYDEFTTRVDDENTIGETNGLIEFTITGD